MTTDFDKCNSIPEAFLGQVRERPDAVRWSYPQGSGPTRVWRSETTKEVADSVFALASYLISLGCSKGSHVGIISNTRPEWIVCDLAILSTGATTVSVYPSLTWKDAGFILFDAEVKIVIVENQEQLDKLIALESNECPVPAREAGPDENVRLTFDAIIALEEVTPHPRLIQFREVLKRHEGSAPPTSLGSIRREDVASLVYTSGTTGAPKGVIQTHGNHLSNVAQAIESKVFGLENSIFLFLPLAHSFARLVGYLGSLTSANLKFAGITNPKSSKLDLQAVMADIAEGSANCVPSIPRVFEKIKAGLIGNSLKPGLSSKILGLCLRVSSRRYELLKSKKPIPLTTAILFNATDSIRRKIRGKLFGPHFHYAISGGAKLAEEVHEFFEALGIDIYEGYGLTETCVATNVNRIGKKKIGSVGPAFRGIETRIAEDGEILFKGPNIARGYYKRPKATAEAWDSDGWFHTGDVGHLDDDGYLFITDRKKDLIVTAGGKKISPQMVEGLLKQIPGVSQVVIYGEGKPYCVALVSVDEQVLLEIAKKNHITLVPPFFKDPQVLTLLSTKINELNKDLSSFEQIKKISILPEDLTIENGMLTPTQKPRRKIVLERYRNEIEALYGRQN